MSTVPYPRGESGEIAIVSSSNRENLETHDAGYTKGIPKRVSCCVHGCVCAASHCCIRITRASCRVATLQAWYPVSSNLPSSVCMVASVCSAFEFFDSARRFRSDSAQSYDLP